MKPKTQASTTPTKVAPKAPGAVPTRALGSASQAAPSAKAAVHPAPKATRNRAAQPAHKALTQGAAKPAAKPRAAGQTTGPAKLAIPAPVAAPVAAPVLGKPKHKLVRDSFTIPKDEYGVLVALKQRAGALAHHAKKSEILRAGVQLLSGLSDARFLAALMAVPSLKTGRPKQEPVAPAAQGGKKQGR